MAAEGQAKQAGDRGRRAARVLGAASLIPFVAMVVAMLATGGHSVWSAVVIDGFKTWSVVALCFLGGIRWGLALRAESASSAPYILAALPAAIGWAALFTPDEIAIGILLLAHCAQGAWDSLSAQRGFAPSWFGDMRIVWTLLAAAAHIAIFVAIY
ncbi:MAG: DUF3429 domain-containing protein [Nitratireductor sp.]|nr:DUF3429 domain-containing protein [Nitratireductor sp.]